MDANEPHDGTEKPDNTSEGHDAPAQLARGSTIGRYLVVALIGKGGMGEVYAAYDPELNRKVAIKLFRAQQAQGTDPIEGRARLLREAQAIARLSDPHVVVIYDVGTFDDRVFLAMEFLDGYTLGYWLHAAPRSWREIVATFIAGGRGLASAHRAGIVHRDFKPENVMMTREGQIRVMDFGLARTIEQDGVARDLSITASLRPRPGAGPQFSTDADQDQLSTRDLSAGRRPAPPPSGGAPEPSPPRALAALPIDSSLTLTGALIGTPAYMAPEQFTGDTIDARTDQFSFCVALYEALYGQRPFAGESIPALTANVTAGRIRPAPPSAKVPGWLRRVLLRGLRADRGQRYPSMEALLAALNHDPARTSRNWTALVALLALLAAAGASLGRGEQKQRTECRGSGARLAGIWEPADQAASSPHKEAIRSAFLATARPYAGDSFVVVARALDRYAGAWRDMRRDVCEATHVRGEQSAEVLDLRMSCLDERLAEVGTLTAVFEHADPEVVVKAAAAVQSLRPIEQCADVAALRAVVRPPEDPATRQRLAELRARLAAIKARIIAGRTRGAAKDVSQLVDEAEAANYAPIMAESLLQLGEVQFLSGEPAIAEKSYEEAIWLAEGSRHDEAVLEAADQLIAITGFSQRRHQDGERWANFAAALLRRLGPGHDLLKAWRANNLAMVYYDEGRLEDALRMFTDAVTIKTRTLGEHHWDVALSLENQAAVLHEMGRTDEALKKNRRAIEILHDTLGDSHPKMGEAWSDAAEFLNASRRYTEAHAMARQAIVVAEREPDADGSGGQLPVALIALGVSWLERGQPALAVAPLERALHAADAGTLEPSRAGQARFALARALAATKGPPARTLALAVAARAAFESSPRLAAQKAELDKWIEARSHAPGKRGGRGGRRP